MPPKRATFFTCGDETVCSEAKKFIEDAGYILTVRDLKKSPMSYRELNKLIGFIDLKHFLNKLSEGYKKNNLDNNNLERTEVLKLIEQDQTMLKMPIIKSVRLVTIGCNKDRIARMLQISSNGTSIMPDNQGNIRSNSHLKRRIDKKPAVASK